MRPDQIAIVIIGALLIALGLYAARNKILQWRLQKTILDKSVEEIDAEREKQKAAIGKLDSNGLLKWYNDFRRSNRSK